MCVLHSYAHFQIGFFIMGQYFFQSISMKILGFPLLYIDWIFLFSSFAQWNKACLFHSSQFLLEWVVVFCFLTIKSGEGILFVYFDRTQREIQDRCLLGCWAFLMLHPTPRAIPREKKTQNNLLRWFTFESVHSTHLVVIQWTVTLKSSLNSCVGAGCSCKRAVHITGVYCVWDRENSAHWLEVLMCEL